MIAPFVLLPSTRRRGRQYPATYGSVIATMRNVKGVRITLHSASQGVAAQAGPEGIKITLEH